MGMDGNNMKKEGYHSISNWFSIIILYFLLKIYFMVSSLTLIYLHEIGRHENQVYLTLLNLANDSIVASLLLLGFAVEIVFNIIKKYIWRRNKNGKNRK